MKNGKRIQNVKIIREIDSDPDTSLFGSYAGKPANEFSIDRLHKPECASQEYSTAHDTYDKLTRAIQYLQAKLYVLGNTDTAQQAALTDAIDILDDAREKCIQCDCSGVRIDSNSYKYFNPASGNYAGLKHAEIVKYCLQAYARMEALENQDWYFMGITAKAEILVPSGPYSLLQTITSGGMWSVESDAGEPEFLDIEADQLAELKGQLKALGFSERALAEAFKTVQRVTR
jgi:hypothetical protein